MLIMLSAANFDKYLAKNLKLYYNKRMIDGREEVPYTKPRLFHFRPVFYCFVAFAIGIACAYYIFTLNVVIIGILLAGLIALLALSLYTKTIKRLLVVIIAFVIGMGVFAIDYKNFNGYDYNGETAYVCGRVSEHIYYYEDFCTVILEDVKINNKPQNNISVDIYTHKEFNTGQILEFTTEVYNTKAFTNGVFNNYAYKMGTSYYCEVTYSDLTVTDGELRPAEKLKNHVLETLQKFMSPSVAGLAYSILFGNMVNLDDTIKNDFSVAGIAHLVAVSGLNIAFLTAMLYFLFRKRSMLFRFIVIAITLFVYCYLCDFVPSISRASLMCLTFLVMQMFARQRHMLNSIGMAGIVILLIAPSYVYNMGFQMSFLSVLAIAILAGPVTRLLKKGKLKHALAEAIAIDVTTTIAILPIIVLYYGKLSLLSTLTNLICIPVFGIGYMMLFVMTIVVCVLPFLGFVLIIPNAIFTIIITIAHFVAGLDVFVINLVVTNIILTFALYVVLFFGGRFFLGNIKQKIVVCSAVFCVTLLLSSALCSQAVINKDSYTQLNIRGDCAVITTKSGDVVVIGGEKDPAGLVSYLQYNNMYYISTWIITGNSNSELEVVRDCYDVSNFITYTEGTFNCSGFEIEYISSNNNAKGVYLKSADVSILFGTAALGANQVEEIRAGLGGASFDIIYQSGGKNFDALGTYDYIVTKKTMNTDKNISTHTYGNCTLLIENGEVSSVIRGG